jgi:hypothetical protein
MADQAQRIPFHFHAEGHALSGEFRHPGHTLIETQAATSLPTIGGHAQAVAQHYQCQDFARFSAAHTHVSGRWVRNELALTHATAVVEDLNILEVLTADRIVSRLSSRHVVNEREGHITAEGSSFLNVRIHGFDVTVELRTNLLRDHKTHAALREHVLAEDPKSDRIAREQNGILLCSLATKIKTDLPGAQIRGHQLRVPDFGVLSFAEVFSETGTRTLTMLRLQLGSPHIANITAAETRSNGQPSPPTP